MKLRKILSLSQPLTLDTLIKIKLKRSPEEQQQKLITDRKNKIKRIKNTIRWLHERYPECFNQLDPKPLKLHIEQDILKDLQNLIDNELKQKPSTNLIRGALNYYTHSKKYFESYFKHTHRINLNGEPLETFPITEQQKIYAQGRLDYILNILDQRTKSNLHKIKN